MENLFGLAALIAWHPWLAYGLIVTTCLLRRIGWQLPSYVAAVVVGASVGLSHPDAVRLVTPPHGGTALDPFVVAIWLLILTFAAEWPSAQPAAMPASDRTVADAPPRQVAWLLWTRALREALLTATLFLAACWRPTFSGWLLTLLTLYALAILGLRLYAVARRLRVQRRLAAAAATGATGAQQSQQPDAAGRSHRAQRQRAFALSLGAVALGLGASLYVQVVPGSNWYQVQIGLCMISVGERAAAIPYRDKSEAGFQLAMEADCLKQIAPIPLPWWRLHCAVAQAEFGIDPYPERRGYFLRTYISPVDDSPQVYTVWVPSTYDANRPLPLVVWLHGHVGFRQYHGLWIPLDLWTEQAIVMAPQARGSLDYTGIQLNEVATAIADVQRRYRIDAERVYLAGHSMGGTGSWYLGSQWADRIAAIAPSAPNLSPWAWGYRPPTGDPIPDDLAIRLQRNEAAIGHVERLRDMPILASHSNDDALVPVENSRLMIAALRALYTDRPASVPQIYLESQSEGIGHKMAMPAGQRLTWLLQFQIPPSRPRQPPPPPASPPVPAYGPIYRAFDEPFVLIIPDGVMAYGSRQPADRRELALQQIAREVSAFDKFWQARFQARPRILSVSAYLASQDERRATWHPILLGGPDVNLATAMLIQGDGPFAAWRLPDGFDAREDNLTAAGRTARGPAILYAIAPPVVREDATPSPPFAVVIAASHGAAYFQALRRYGVQFGSYALRNRIWFDYALCDAQSFDNTRLIHTYGFYTPAGEPDGNDPTRAYRGSMIERVAVGGALWPPPPTAFLRHSPPSAPTSGAQPAPQPFRHALYEHLPSLVDSDTPLAFHAHAKGEPLHLGGDPAQSGANARICPRGISFGAVGSVSGPARAEWTLPPGRWKLTGRVGPDFAVYPPLVFAALDALNLPGSEPRRPVAGYRVRVDGQECWVSAQPQKPAGVKRKKNARASTTAPVADPPAWQQLEYELNLTLPPGRTLTLEVFTLRGNPWELPPTVWADVQLERVD